MLFLALHVLGNAAFLLLVRVGRGGRFDYPLVGLTNYATAAALAAVALAMAGPGGYEPRAAVFGAVNGTQYQVTYVLMYALYGLVGVAVTTSILRLAVVVPVLASIAIWREWPATAQALGLGLAGAALPLLSGTGARVGGGARRSEAAGGGTGGGTGGGPGGLKGDGTGAGGGRPPAAVGVGMGGGALMVGTLLISGCGLLAAKAFAELGRPEQRPVYVLACYGVATALSVALWPLRRRLQRAPADGMRAAWRRSVGLGVVVGAVNVGQIWALLPALAQVPGVIAFPVAAAGGLALAVLGARVLWEERLSRRAGAGIALALGAAALANVR